MLSKISKSFIEPIVTYCSSQFPLKCNLCGKEYADFLQLMGAAREKLLAAEHAPEAHKKKFEDLIENGLIDLIKNRKIDKIDALLKETLGNGYVYKSLMNQHK